MHGYAAIHRACDVLRAHAGTRPVPLGDLLPGPVLRAARSVPPRAPDHLGERPGQPWVAGATDELPEHRHVEAAHRRPTLLRRVPELGRITEGPGRIELGAAVTVAEIQASPLMARRWPDLAEHLEQFGSPAVRTSATIGGNLVHASPTADLAVPLLAMDASAVVSPVLPQVGPGGRARSRVVGLPDFFRGRRSVDLQPGEIVVAVRIPDPPPGAALHLERVAKRRLDDIASVSLATVLGAGPDGRLTDVRLAAGGVAPIPLLLRRTADALRGSVPDSALVRRALAELAEEVSPIDDVRGSAGYKRALLGHLVLAALDEVVPGLAVAVLSSRGWSRAAGVGEPGATR